MTNSKNILLTGGAGYIGSHTALSLLDQGHKVTIIDSLVTGNKELIPQQAKFIECDIADEIKIENLLLNNKYDALMHFAGFIRVDESIDKPEMYMDNNVKKSYKLFNLCIKNGLNNFIFSSTAAVYGNNNNLLVDEKDKINPLNPYAKSKILIEEYLKKKDEEKLIKYISLRYFNVAGSDPLLRSGLISKNPTHLIKVACEVAVNKRDYIEIFGNDYPTPDGTAIRDYIHVSDLADLHVLSLNYLLSQKSSSIMNCGYGHGYSVKLILDKLNKITKKPLDVRIGKKRNGDAISLVANVEKIKRKLSWKPQYDDIEYIIETAIKWETKILNEKIF